jgi:hypothetical protein
MELDIKKEIIDLWSSVKRPNMNLLIKWLEDSDFFIAPSSISHLHHDD